MKLNRLIAPAAAVLLLFTGCATSPDEPAASSAAAGVSFDLPAAGGEVNKDVFVATAAAAQQEVKSYQTIMTSETVTPNNGTQTATTTFQYDFSDASTPRVRSTSSTGTETVYIGGDMWTRPSGGAWTHTTNSASAVVAGGGMESYVNQVAGEISKVVYAGDEQLDQVNTHHFVFTPVQADGASAQAHDDTDYWTDSDLRPVRIQTSVTTSGITSTTTMDFSQYGATFNIEAPAS